MSAHDILNNLEQRVAALEQQLGDTPGVSTLQPNVLTIAPGGLIGAFFPGGVQMDEQNAIAYAVAGALGWKSTDGVVREWLEGLVTTGPIRTLAAVSQADPNDWAQLRVISRDAGGAGGSSVFASAEDSAGNYGAGTIIDSLARSSFLQLLSTQKLRVDHGSSEITWDGTSTQSGGVTINHGLGVVPAQILLGENWTALNYALGYANLTNLSFEIFGDALDAVPAAGTVAGIDWLALG